jgi:hypothetical protein
MPSLAPLRPLLPKHNNGSAARRGIPQPGRGRPLGSAAVRTREIANQLARNGETPLEILADAYKHFLGVAMVYEAAVHESGFPLHDKRNARLARLAREARLDAVTCAEAASPFIHAKLQPVPADDKQKDQTIVIYTPERSV